MDIRRMPLGLPIIIGLNRLNKHIYAGTVPAHVKAKRRAKAKAAKIARRVNR